MDNRVSLVDIQLEIAQEIARRDEATDFWVLNLFGWLMCAAGAVLLAFGSRHFGAFAHLSLFAIVLTPAVWTFVVVLRDGLQETV